MWSIEKRAHDDRAIFVKIAATVTDDIRRGALRGGDRLPSSRVLATRLAINRNTVVAAYDELIAQGWITSRGPAGTFVATDLPDRHVPRSAAPSLAMLGRPAYDVPPTGELPWTGGDDDAPYRVSFGAPDPRLFPRTLISRAYRRALRSRAAIGALDYGDARGTQRLRGAIAAMLRATRGIPAGAENVLVTGGSQQALDLIARLLIRPGDAVAIEELGYRAAWTAFELAGATLAPVPVDAAGIIVAAIPRARTRAVYVTPHHQYPTTVLMSSARRLALLELARRDRVAIIEDDYDHEFHFDGRPVAPLASDDRHGSVLYIGSFSKVLAPGLRLGYVAAPATVIDALGRLRAHGDRHGDHVLELAIAELLEDGDLPRHVHKMRRTYAARRAAFAELVERELGSALTFELPAGGITVWARADSSIKLAAWQQRARARGVAFGIARDFAFDRKPRPFIRLAFARYDERELADAIRRMRRALTA